MASRFHQALENGQVLEVPMNDVQFVSFSSQIRSIGTQNLNGCTGVAIFSGGGAILAHIPPNPNPEEAIANLRRLMGRFMLLYRQHLAQFPSRATSLVVGGTFGSAPALEHHLIEIRAVLSREGITPAYRSYEVSWSQLRGPASGTVFIDARSGAVAVYVEDRLLLI